MKEIIVYTDYVCPYCLLAEKLLRAEIKDSDIKITWKPHELRPFPVPTLQIKDGYLPSIWETSVYPMAKKLAVDIKLPTISPQPRTDKAFQAFALAEKYGLGDAFSMATLSAFFQKNQDIGQVSVLLQIAGEISLNKAELNEALASEQFSEIHHAALKHAKQVDNIKVVPTIIIGAERFEGVPSQAWIKSALARLESAELVE